MKDSIAILPLIVSIGGSSLRGGTSVAFAALGETMAERSGVINLGIEGVMLMGAMTAVAVQISAGSPSLALICAGAVGASLAALHAFLVVYLRCNQIVTGLSVSLAATGLSGFLGRPFVGVRFKGIDNWDIPGLSGIPVVGPILFQQNPMVYLGLIAAAAVWFVLFRTRFGLQIRAVGEDPEVAYARGVDVRLVRLAAVTAGGFLGGLGGAYLSLAYTQTWAERMTAGQGWIALGLVIVGAWNPLATVLMAYSFGALNSLNPVLQAAGLPVSPFFLSMLPYLAAVLALAGTSILRQHLRRPMPAALLKELRGVVA